MQWIPVKVNGQRAHIVAFSADAHLAVILYSDGWFASWRLESFLLRALPLTENGRVIVADREEAEVKA